jgi:hypothetical protein
MNPSLIAEYRQQRQHHHTGSSALRAARILLAFKRVEQFGLVRLHVEPEIDCYDMSYIDTWEISDKKKEAEKKSLSDRIDQEGCWILVAQYKDEDSWKTVDSVGGFIGDDWQNSGYDIDMMLGALEAAADNYIKHNISTRL